jgi:prepilin-type N-terminal cleavage/methylation domain-containing protein
VTRRAGVTLVELIVVIALLGVIAGVTGLAFQRARPVVGADAVAALASVARDSALRTGRTVTLRISALGARRSADLTAYPDGRVIADPSLGIDPLSGRVQNAAR